MVEKKQAKKMNVAIIVIAILVVIAMAFGIYKIAFSNPADSIVISDKDSDTQKIEKMQNKIELLNQKISKLQEKMDPELEKLNRLYEEYTSIISQFQTTETTETTGTDNTTVEENQAPAPENTDVQ